MLWEWYVVIYWPIRAVLSSLWRAKHFTLLKGVLTKRRDPKGNSARTHLILNTSFTFHNRSTLIRDALHGAQQCVN